MAGLASRRQAAWGSTPGGSITRCSPRGEDDVIMWLVPPARILALVPVRKIYGSLRFVPQVLRYHARTGEEAVMVSQPYVYQRRELAEPDWRRFPGWAG